MTNKELLELARIRLNCNYYKIAKLLDVPPNKISDAKNGRQPLPERNILTLCKLIEIDPAIALSGTIAERTKDPEKKKIWEKVAKIVETNIPL